uniref:Chemokine interleukin-8-like domain-containing protein n=1 Tax=Ornithorhynchus anatinus TaxID=9258 RepID=A0A6I8NS61_ORNAN
MQAPLSFSSKAESLGKIQLRCQCIRTHSDFIHPKFFANIQYIPAGPLCDTPEVIAEMKQGNEICLDPNANWVKIIIQKILSRCSIRRRFSFLDF